MILYNRRSNNNSSLRERLFREPYHIINLIFAGVIVLIITYSGIFSPEKNNYPVICIHEKITGEPCFSCGLSHSFSLIIRGRISEAYEWNIYGMRVFLFFISQLFFRLVFLGLSLRHQEIRKHLIVYDCIATLILFIISFWPFIGSLITRIQQIV